MTYICLKGPVPSKKNTYRRGKGNSFYLPSSVSSQLDSLVMQAKLLWHCRQPVANPFLILQFTLSSRRKDGNNLQQTILDVLQRAGVLKNDNVAWCNGPHLLLPTIVDPKAETEKTEIVIG